MRRFLVLSIIALLAIQATSSAQIEKMNLAGKHTIFLESGFKTNSKTTSTTANGTVEATTGFIGSLNYGYWFDEEWALTFSGGVFGAEANVKFNNVSANAIMPILFGVRYYPVNLALGSVGRFYAGTALGQYLGSAAKTSGFVTQTINESVFGGQASIGCDLFVASWFKFGPKLSYFFLSDFKEIIGTEKNLSGAGFSIDFGFVL